MTHSHAEGLLRELLATIYDDGGHETERLGLVEATYAAIKIVSRLLAESGEACFDDPLLDPATPPAEVDATLRAQGLDPDALAERGVAEVERLKAEREEALASHRVCAAAAAELLNDLYEEVLRLTTERNEARAEVERLRAERDEARSVLRERLQVDPGGSDRIDELEQAMQFTRHKLEVTRDERNEARAEVERLKAERDEAQALAAEMWKNASDWTGPTASSHYRSEISERLVRLKAEETPAPVKIAELEQALQFTRHELEVTRDALDLLRAEARLADESDEVVPFVAEVERLKVQAEEAHRSACNQRTVRERAEREVERLRAENEKLRVAVAEAAKAVYQLTKVLNGGLV